MLTPSQYTALLRKKWIDYLSASVELRDEKNVKLEAFLNKILYVHEKYKFEKCPEFSDLTSCGNILTSQFLTDVHQVCTECSMESEDVTPLIHYLLEGRGWKILWLIKFVGVQSLHSNQDLAKLLLSLFPLYNQFNLYSLSQNNTACSFADKHAYDNVESCFQAYIRTRTQTLFSQKRSRDRGSPRFKKRAPIDYRKTSPFKFHIGTVESSDSDYTAGIRRDKKEQLVQYRQNPMDFIYFSKANVKSSDELDSDDTLSLDEKVHIQELGKRSISFVQFCENVISLLQKICLEDEIASNKTQLCPPISAEVLPFALSMFASVHQDCGYIGNWSPRDAYRIKQQLLFLIFTSASSLVCIPDGLFVLDQHCVIQHLLALVGSTQFPAGEAESKSSDCAITKEESLLLNFNVVYGCLMLMCILSEQCLARQDFEGLLKGIYFSPNQRQIIANSLAMYESRYEENSKVCNRISQLIHMLTQSVALMKSKRVVHWHVKECNKLRHKRCNFKIYNHHHHDTFGIWKNQCPTNEDQLCCIANFLTVLLEIYQTSSNVNTHALVLNSFKRVGLCCCLQVDIVLNSLLSCLQVQSPRLRQSVFNFIETIVLEQLTGSINFAATLQFCAVCKCKYETTTSMLKIVQNSVNNSEPVTVFELNTILNDNVTVWGAVKLYCDILFTNDLSIFVHQVEKHVLQLCLSGNQLVGIEIFLRVVIPIFLNAQVSSKENNHLITWCLTAFSILLKHIALAEIFLKLSGLELLKRYLKLAAFRALVLRILHVLIIVEVDKVDDNIKLTDLISLRGFETILLELCTGVIEDNNLQETQREETADGRIYKIPTQAQLEYQCDIWSSAMSLISKSHTCKLYFRNGPISEISYKLLVKLLQIMSQEEFSSAVTMSDRLQARRFLKGALNLFEVLLAFCLRVCPFVVGGTELISETDLNEVSKKYVFSFVTWHPDDLRLLVESMTNAIQETPARMKRKTEQLYLEAYLPVCEEIDFQDIDLDTSAQANPDKSFSQMDDGYEADVEQPDLITDHQENSLSPTDNQLIYMGIMEIVLEILRKMIKAQNVVDDPNDVGIRALTSIINRLVGLCRDNFNNCLGLYNQNILLIIIQDFRKFFCEAKNSLRELQSNLLDLFVIIGKHSITCEILKLFISLFKQSDPPLDLLLTAFSQLTANSSPESECFLCFPSNAQNCSFNERIIPHAESLLTNGNNSATSSNNFKMERNGANITVIEPNSEITQMMSYEHSEQNILSPWCKAACVIPVHNSPEISLTSKFSFNLWLKTCAPGRQFFSRAQHRRQLASENVKVREKEIKYMRENTNDSSMETSGVFTSEVSDNGENFNSHVSTQALHLVSFGQNPNLFEIWSLPAFESLVLRLTTNCNHNYSIVSESMCKSLLKLDQWHHMSVNYYIDQRDKNNIAKVKIIVDGYISDSIALEMKNICTDKTNSLNVLLLGHEDVSDEVGSLSWHLGYFALMKDLVLELDVNLAISALGPNDTNFFSNMAQTERVNFPVQPTRNFLKTGLNPTLLQKAFNVQLSNLQDATMILYTPHNPQFCTRYCAIVSQSDINRERKNIQQTSDVVSVHLAHNLKVLTKNTVDGAMSQLGGVSAMLLLLCRIVECCSQDDVQANAIALVLRFVGSTARYRTDFLNLNGPSLLTKIFSATQFCGKYLTLKTIINACLSSPVLLGDYLRKQPIFSQNANAIILDAEVLTSALTLWRTWGKNDVNIQNTFFLAIKELISDIHPYHNFNRRQLSSNFISIILTSFKERFVEDRLKMPKDTCHLIISLMGTMLAYPPDVGLLRSIFDFLLLAHPAANTHLSDDSYNFYFSLHPSARFGPITIAVSSGLNESKDSSLKVAEKSVTKLKSNAAVPCSSGESLHNEGPLVNKLSQVQFEDARCNDLSDVSDSLEYNTAEAESANGEDSRLEKAVHSKQNKKQLSKNNAVQIVATTKTENLRLLYMNSAGTSNSTTHYCPAIGEARTFYQDYEIIHDIYNVSSPEVIPGPEDGSASEEWEVLTVLESQDVCAQSCLEQNYLVILCSGLLNMLVQLLENSPHRMRDAIASSVIRIEELLVFANNSNNNIRTAVIKLLHAYLNFATEEQVNLFLKIKGFIMLANQIRRHFASVILVEASLSLMLDRNFTFENYNIETVNISTSLQQASIALILAIMPTLTIDTALCHNLINFVLQVFIMYPDVIQIFIDNALLEVIIQVIANILNSEPRSTDLIHSEEQDLLFDDVKKLLDQISVTAVSFESSVRSTTLDDMLILLLGLETRESKHQSRGKRSAQKIRFLTCTCMQSAIDRLYQLSLVEDRSTTSKYLAALRMPFPLDSGSSSGKTTRNKIPQSQVVEYLHLLLAKCVDFLVYSDATDDCLSSRNYEKSFARYVTQLLLQLDCTLSSSKTVVRSVKQGLKLQLLRLLVYLLSPVQSVDQRLFAVTVIMKEQRPKILLRSILRANGQLRDLFCTALKDLSSNGSIELLEEELKTCRQLMAIVHSLNTPTSEFVPNWFYESGRKKVWLLACERQENKILSRRDNLIVTVCESAKTITRNIIITQNKVRKDFLAVVKTSHGEKIQIRTMWENIVSKLTHERAIWHFPESYPKSWELHFIEGPHRERRRLQRSHLHLDNRYLLSEQRFKLDAVLHPEPFHFLSETDDLSFGCPALVDCLHANEKIRYNSTCTIITPSSDVTGDILIGNVCLYFIGEDFKSNSLNDRLDHLVSLKWMFEDVKEIIVRRYELQDNAIEIFLLNGETYLLSFQTGKDRDTFHQFVMASPLPNLVNTQELAVLTEHWQDGSLTNFDYLMQLNKFSGRSFNDLMQYPIFPFLLSNYTGVTLNLLDPQNFRNLSKPMAIQEKKREQHYLNTYQYWKVEQRKGNSFPGEMMPTMDPYHYGSHYSNSITVLYFLVRLPPFTGIFLKYQDRNFDIPDRSFHSINTTWRLSSSESNTDMKELIPEMFFLPELLKNFEGFDFGVRQAGERVEDVILPPWCRNDPRLFVLINRQALESDYATEHLCEWIDLIFGYKQTGKAAVEAINVFHPTTYYGFKLDTICDPIQRAALKTMIRTLGQTPRQLFQSAHPMVTLSILGDNKTINYKRLPLVLPELQGLKWGRYVGSPASERPVMRLKKQENSVITSFVALKTNDVFGMAENCCLILSYSKENVNINYATYVANCAIISWGHLDGNIRIKWRRDQKSIVLVSGTLNDPVVYCNTVPESPILFAGHRSGIILAYEIDVDANKSTAKFNKQPTWLYGHTAEIISLCVCSPFGIMVSASVDGTCIVWDLNSLSYVRSITNKTVRLIAISSTTGDIALVSDTDVGNSLQLYGINCNLIGEISISVLIHSVCFSSAPEGISVNVIATGLANGQIKLWSTWDLTPVSIIEIDEFSHPIISLTYAADSQLLCAANSKGVLVLWESENKATGKSPKYQSLF